MKVNKKGRFIGKVVLVTGGARGIGKNIAEAFGKEGAKVIVCDIDKLKGKRTVAEFIESGISAEYLFEDLSKNGGPQSMVRKVVNKHNKLDVLINNARSGGRYDMAEETEETWDNGMSVTLKASFFASQEAVYSMSRSGGGCIVAISSIAAILTCHQSPIYHIAKAGILQMTKYLAAFAGRHNVRVNAVLPGFVVQDENMKHFIEPANFRYRKTAEFCHPLGQVCSSDEIANVVLFLCSKESGGITGQSLIVDKGLSLEEQSNLVFRFSKNKRWIK